MTFTSVCERKGSQLSSRWNEKEKQEKREGGRRGGEESSSTDQHTTATPSPPSMHLRALNFRKMQRRTLVIGR